MDRSTARLPPQISMHWSVRVGVGCGVVIADSGFVSVGKMQRAPNRARLDARAPARLHRHTSGAA